MENGVAKKMENAIYLENFKSRKNYKHMTDPRAVEKKKRNK